MRRDFEVGIGDREDGVDVGGAAVRVPLLLAVQDVVVALLDARPRAGSPASLPANFSERPKAMSFSPLRDRREPAVLLLLGAADQDREGAERVHGVEDADAAARARQLLDADAEVEDAAARRRIPWESRRR